MRRIDNRFATDSLSARTVCNHDSRRFTGRVRQHIRYIAAVEELYVVVDQLVFQRFLYMKRSREIFPGKSLRASAVCSFSPSFRS